MPTARYRNPERLRDYLVEDVLGMLRASRQTPWGRLLGAWLKQPAGQLAALAIEFESRVQTMGLPEACRALLPRFITSSYVSLPAEIPSSGPLLIAANHPGLVDGVLIAARVARRDLKIVVSNLDIFSRLEGIRRHIILTSKETHERLIVVREAIRHLQQGGALLIFPGGMLEPDPALFPGLQHALRRWSASLNIILRRAPETKVTIAIVSGVISPAFLRNPLSRFQRSAIDRQKAAQVLQAVRQLISDRTPDITPRIHFSAPTAVSELCAHLATGDPLEAIRLQALDLIQRLPYAHILDGPGKEFTA